MPNIIIAEARELTQIDGLIEEINQHRSEIALADQIVKQKLAAVKSKLELWREEAIRPHLKAIANLEPQVADAVKRLTKDADSKSLKLPSGRAGFRKTPPQFTFAGEKADANNRALVEKLAAEKSEFVYYKPALDWAGLRKTLQIVGDTVYNKFDGAVLEGMSGVQPPDTFFVERAD